MKDGRRGCWFRLAHSQIVHDRADCRFSSATVTNGSSFQGVQSVS